MYRFLAITVLLDAKDISQIGPLQWGRITDPFSPESSAAPRRTESRRSLSFTMTLSPAFSVIHSWLLGAISTRNVQRLPTLHVDRICLPAVLATSTEH